MSRLALVGIVALSSACGSCGSSDDATKVSTGGKPSTGGTSSSTGGTTASGGTTGIDAAAEASLGGAPSGGGAGGLPACPTFAAGQKLGNVARLDIKEASGIAESRRNAEVIWTHNDSGDGPRVFAVKKDGTDLGAFAFAGADAVDWEDIALGPGPKTGESYIYAGDIGDNPSTRANVKVYRAIEPNVDPAAPANDATVSGVETFTFVYPDGAHNAETLFVDPKSGDLYIVTKVGAGSSQVFRAAAPLSAGATITMSEVAKIDFSAPPLDAGAATTGGDMSFAGDAVVIKTYSSAFLWRRPAGKSVGEALQGEACKLPLESEPQGEAIGFTASGGYLTLSEGQNQPIWSFAKK